jgi:hypothetical protein
MGYDACIRDPTNTSRDAPEGAWVMTIHLSYNHGVIFKKYGFYPRDLNGFTIREVLVVLDAAIAEMQDDGIIVDTELLDFLASGTDEDMRLRQRCYEADISVVLTLLLDVKRLLSRPRLQRCIWESD